MAAVNHIRLRSTVVVAGILLQTLAFIVAEAVAPTPTERRLIDHSGFINIDCGLSTSSYYHEKTTLYYTSDEKYITTGKNRVISSSLSTTDNGDDRFSQLRSFPDGNRNCYNLSPVEANQKYLIRAWFLYGNYDGASSLPGFDLYVGVDYWVTVAIKSVGSKFGSEIVYVATADFVDVCLVNTGHGTPFISVLELRPLDNAAYAATREFSLRQFNRCDVGPSADDPADRWYNLTDDAYDRVWFYSKKPSNWKPINTNQSMYTSSSDSPYRVPTGVLATAGEQIDGHTNFSFGHSVSEPTAKLYAYWHFAELERLDSNKTREFNILVPHGPGYKFGPVRPSYLRLTTVESTEIPLNGSESFVYSLQKTDQSSLLPILNAAELYVVMERRFSPTNQEDVDAVNDIKKKCDVQRIWQGDPCLPIKYQWDSLICAYNGSNPPRITALNLSSSNLTGELPGSLSNLTSLSYLNLSNNGFTGKIPEFLAHLPALKFIDLSRNNLIGPVPNQLAKKASNKSIDLRLEGNPDVCKSYPCKKKKKKKGVKQLRHSLIIPLIASIALILLFVMISGLILVAYRKRVKQECKGSVDQAIKSRNKQFNYSEIVKITNNFRKILGKGAFGTVYYGLLQDGTQVAVKILNNNTCPLTIRQFCAEAELLMKIHHINLVSLIGYCDEHAKMALVYEYMSHGNLQTHLSVRNEHPLSWKTRLEILIDTAQGLEYLHSGCQPQIIHRDVKPGNILLDETGHAKISDFGLSRYFTTHSQAIAMTDLAGTPGYCDPEYVQLNKLSEKSDVYGFGVVLMEMITGQPPFIRYTSETDDCIHIVEWVKQEVESGDILMIVDERLHREFNVNSAWRLLEIAVECVKPRGDERPRMSEVVAELKLCYASEQIDLADEDDDADYVISGCLDSSGQFDGSPDCLLPSAR